MFFGEGISTINSSYFKIILSLLWILKLQYINFVSNLKLKLFFVHLSGQHTITRKVLKLTLEIISYLITHFQQMLIDSLVIKLLSFSFTRKDILSSSGKLMSSIIHIFISSINVVCADRFLPPSRTRGRSGLGEGKVPSSRIRSPDAPAFVQSVES